jgi:hypothetical protein
MQARRCNYQVRKSRKEMSSDNFGQYMLIDDHNRVVLGSRFDASLKDIEDFFDANPLGVRPEDLKD